MDIANFFNQNGVNYIYEHPYEIDTRTSEYGQYHPDFYLPDYHIYVEYFGINRQGEVPSYFTGSHGMTATENYRTSMQWKTELHKQNNTDLIECFSYEKSDNELLDNLKRNLEDRGVMLSPKTAEEMWSQVIVEGDSILEGLVELFETVINLIKSNDDTIANIRQTNTGSRNAQSNELILCLIEPIFNSYCEYLISHHEIDFNDMINKAASYVKTDKYKNPYRYVIVDEYQDISRARFSLLKAMRDSMDYDLFCVGDDWQSIYRFAGSDIGYILDFSKYWGPTEISKIETTYRFTRSLIDVSGQFIMQNPMQIKKSIQGNNHDNAFALAEVNGYTEKSAVAFLAKKIEDFPQHSSVFFIGRYSFDVNLLNESESFNCRYNNQTGFVDVEYSLRRDLKMSFITAHRSKGLQADYVIIINNKRSRMGFPSKIQDAAILDLLLGNCDQYPNAEERRLYYVAMTRAKKKAILLTVKDQESEFAMELREKYAEELKKEQFTCPLCGGHLTRKSGPYGEFFGCSSYKTTGCKYTRKIIKGNPLKEQNN
jgi:DNA helicase IV